MLPTKIFLKQKVYFKTKIFFENCKQSNQEIPSRWTPQYAKTQFVYKSVAIQIIYSISIF